MQNMLECRRSFHGYTMLIIDYLAYRDSFSSSFDVNLLCSGVDSQVTYTKLSTLLKMSVNPNATTGYLFCAHCNENVSESTFRRHQILYSKTLPNNGRKRVVVSSSDSESEVSIEREGSQG